MTSRARSGGWKLRFDRGAPLLSRRVGGGAEDAVMFSRRGRRGAGRGTGRGQDGSCATEERSLAATELERPTASTQLSGGIYSVPSTRIDQASSVPMSRDAPSTTLNVQLPRALTPWKA